MPSCSRSLGDDIIGMADRIVQAELADKGVIVFVLEEVLVLNPHKSEPTG